MRRRIARFARRGRGARRCATGSRASCERSATRRSRSATFSRKRVKSHGRGERDVERIALVSPLLARVTAIVCRPRATWRAIANERTPPAALFLGYVFPLAAIGPIATYVLLRETGRRVAAGAIYHESIRVALGEAAISFAYALVGVPLVAAIVRAFAPMFGCTLSFSTAFAIATYAFTPIWIAGALLLAPQIASAQLFFALYAIILLALGLAIVGGIGTVRASFFAALAIACAVGSGFAFGALGAIVRAFLNLR